MAAPSAALWAGRYKNQKPTKDQGIIAIFVYTFYPKISTRFYCVIRSEFFSFVENGGWRTRQALMAA